MLTASPLHKEPYMTAAQTIGELEQQLKAKRGQLKKLQAKRKTLQTTS